MGRESIGPSSKADKIEDRANRRSRTEKSILAFIVAQHGTGEKFTLKELRAEFTPADDIHSVSNEAAQVRLSNLNNLVEQGLLERVGKRSFRVTDAGITAGEKSSRAPHDIQDRVRRGVFGEETGPGDDQDFDANVEDRWPGHEF